MEYPQPNINMGVLTRLNKGAFYGCSSLTSIEISNGVTSIGDYAFSGCSSLTSLEIPSSVTSIGNSAFNECISLQYNEYENGLYLGNSENQYLVFVKAKTTYYISGYKINESTKIIGSRAFDASDYLARIEIPSSVTSIGDYAFSGCGKLTNLTFRENSQLTSIGKSAFSYCSRLPSIEIPINVTYIGNSAFYNCSRLTIYCEADSKPSGWVSSWNYSNCPVVWGYKG